MLSVNSSVVILQLHGLCRRMRIACVFISH